MKPKKINVCKGCGRDCRGVYCARCLGHSCHHGGGHKTLKWELPIHEDRYDEESGPDDVYDVSPHFHPERRGKRTT